jgi:hypothetical protein
MGKEQNTRSSVATGIILAREQDIKQQINLKTEEKRRFAEAEAEKKKQEALQYRKMIESNKSNIEATGAKKIFEDIKKNKLMSILGKSSVVIGRDFSHITFLFNIEPHEGAKYSGKDNHYYSRLSFFVSVVGLSGEKVVVTRGNCCETGFSPVSLSRFLKSVKNSSFKEELNEGNQGQSDSFNINTEGNLKVETGNNGQKYILVTEQTNIAEVIGQQIAETLSI